MAKHSSNTTVRTLAMGKAVSERGVVGGSLGAQRVCIALQCSGSGDANRLR